MKTTTVYTTRDGKTHATQGKAECHALDSATACLRDLLADCPAVPSPYVAAQQIIHSATSAPNPRVLHLMREALAWLEDSQPPAHEED